MAFNFHPPFPFPEGYLTEPPQGPKMGKDHISSEPTSLQANRLTVRRFRILLVAVVVCLPLAGLAQTQVGLPGDRYSISPYLQDSYLFTQSGEGGDAVRLDFSVGMKYMRQPWRLYLETDPDAVQVPVNDHMQFRPGVSFSYKRYIDLGVVVPVAYQSGGSGEVVVPGIDSEAGAHLLDPELFVRVPFLHERPAGFGLALATHVFVPVGQNQNFVGTKSWQGALLLLAADWRSNGFCVALNTGAHLREHAHVLSTPIEPEWLIRPAISYSVPLGSYRLGFAVEANIGTSLYDFFNSENVDAFQMLMSVQIQPAAYTEGFYGAAGGGATALGDGGGYGVPLAHFEGRFGYSLQWGAKRRRILVADKEAKEKLPPGEEPPPGEQPPPGEEGVVVATKVPGEAIPAAGPGELPPGEEPAPEEPLSEPEEPIAVPEPIEEVPEEAPGERVAVAVPEPIETGRPGELPPEEAGEEPGEEPIAVPEPIEEPIPTAAPRELPPRKRVREPRVAVAKIAGLQLIGRSGFGFNDPLALSPDRPASYVDTPAAPAVPPEHLARIVANVEKNLDRIRSTGARILVVGYADKCFEGFPYLANVYNLELSQRRVNAVADGLKQKLGGKLQGIAIHKLPMGRRCANPACECRNPEMPACSDDRRVEVYLDTSTEPFRCPRGEYWLAP